MGRRETTAESQELPAQGVPAKQDGWRVEIKGPANEITVGKGVRKVAPGFPVKFSLLTNSGNRIREATSTFGGGCSGLWTVLVLWPVLEYVGIND